jgi:hypothetical protein
VPEKPYHLAKADYNFKVSAHLKETEFIDWAVTALFYSALHLVDAFLDGEVDLAKDERHPRKHSASAAEGNGGRGRNQLVAALLKPINKEYRSLHEASRRARYDFHKLDKASTDSITTYDRLMIQYRSIEKYVKMRLIAQNSAA